MLQNTKLRLIIDDPLDAATNMATDHAIFKSFLEGNSTSTLRLYSWQSPVLSLGKFQKLTNIDVDGCRSKGIDIVRRPTGGKAVIHLPSELTYSIISGPRLGLPESLAKSYWYVCSAIIEGLKLADINAGIGKQKAGGKKDICYMSASLSDIKVGGRKLIGSAQLREGADFLQHGSIPLSSCRDYIGWAFKFSAKEELDKELETFDRQTTYLQELSFKNINKDDVISCLVQGFQRTWSCELEPAELNDYELSQIELLKNEYSRYF